MNRVAQPVVSNIPPAPAVQEWKQHESLIFKIAFVYFLIQCVPFDWKYYVQLFRFDVTHFQYWFGLSKYYPQFISPESIAQWGIASYANWFIALALAVSIGIVWHYRSGRQRNYDHLYYLLRVLLRYRLAIGVIGYGLIKIFPLQFPQPALSDLYTAYGDFMPWKIYYLTTGFGKAGYQQVIGLFEIIGGLLLLCRKTATLGALVVLLLLSNILVANFAYQLGNHVYASYLMILALAVLWYDVPRLLSLLVKNRFTRASTYHGYQGSNTFRKLRCFLKSGIVAFFLLAASTALYSTVNDRWPYPGEPGLRGAEGFYNVKEYRINGNDLPYSLLDSSRWQNVVFEKWNSISIRKGISAPLDISIPQISVDEQRPYEWQGNGGRYYYRYTIDDKLQRIRLEDTGSKEIQEFQYVFTDNNTIRLSGTGNTGRIDILLEKQSVKQLLTEGRRDPKKKF